MRRSNAAATALPGNLVDQATGTSTSPGPFLARFVLGAVIATTGPEGYLPFGISRYRGGSHTIAQSSTVLNEEVDPALTSEIRRLFDQGAREFFRDGME